METMVDNTVELCGFLAQAPTFSHSLYGERFMSCLLRIARKSQSADLLPITVSERLLTREMKEGCCLGVSGQLRSYNKYVDGANRLVLTVFARSLVLMDRFAPHQNRVAINGFICKPPTFRTTPFMREITDLLVAVNRAYSKSDYIPVITWGRTARFARTLQVGARVSVNGRFQSRTYQKQLENGTIEEKTAYELSTIGLFVPQSSEKS